MAHNEQNQKLDMKDIRVNYTVGLQTPSYLPFLSPDNKDSHARPCRPSVEGHNRLFTIILGCTFGWSIRTSVWSICLGEREEYAFVVINLSGKVVKYNLIAKTNTKIFDIESNQMDDDDDDVVVFIPPFEVDPNRYEFIPSLASA
nr:hypothetical protein [Tanacetum cinerariifolium]